MKIARKLYHKRLRSFIKRLILKSDLIDTMPIQITVLFLGIWNKLEFSMFVLITVSLNQHTLILKRNCDPQVINHSYLNQDELRLSEMNYMYLPSIAEAVCFDSLIPDKGLCGSSGHSIS